MDNFKSKFDKVLIETLDISQVQISCEARFKEDLGADSLELAEFVMKLENEFKISIPDEMAEQIKTVGEAENLVLDFLDKKEIRL